MRMNKLFMFICFALACMTTGIGSAQDFKLFIGQDVDSIEAYSANVNDEFDGVMTYTSVQNAEGLVTPHDSGAGVQYAQKLADHYPDKAIQIGLYMVNASQGVIDGQYDDNLQALAKWIDQNLMTVYLRIGYEFDFRPNAYAPTTYKKAYRYIVDYLRSHRIDNVFYVWHSAAQDSGHDRMNWYPGDEYVDYVGVSFFHPQEQKEHLANVAVLASEVNKPLMIAEATPFGVNLMDTDNAWSEWFVPFFDFIHQYNVSIVCYIHTDWDQTGMFAGQGWGDSRLEQNADLTKRWLNAVNKETRDD